MTPSQWTYKSHHQTTHSNNRLLTMKIKHALAFLAILILSGCTIFTTDRQQFIDYRKIEKFWTYCTKCISSNCDDKDICVRNMDEASVNNEFQLAIINSDIDALIFFLDEMHVDANTIFEEKYKSTPLSTNAYHPGPRADEATKILFDRGGEINHITGGPARSILLTAIRKNNNPVARALMSHGADLSAKSDRGFDACIFAHRWSNFEIMPDLPGCCARISNIEASPELLEERLRPTEFLKYCRK